MAADTREEEPPKRSESGNTNDVSSSRKDETYETFNKRLPNANVLPGGTTNTAGGRPKDVGLVEAAKTVQLEDFRNIHKLPCVRDSLLTGILSGFGLGGVRAVLGGTYSQLCQSRLFQCADDMRSQHLCPELPTGPLEVSVFRPLQCMNIASISVGRRRMG